MEINFFMILIEPALSVLMTIDESEGAIFVRASAIAASSATDDDRKLAYLQLNSIVASGFSCGMKTPIPIDFFLTKLFVMILQDPSVNKIIRPVVFAIK